MEIEGEQESKNVMLCQVRDSYIFLMKNAININIYTHKRTKSLE